ncbi:hypothetical protein AK830_g1933 [Neonectria ditissima]|uniref:DUF159 domain protein n=1 Tax=Neonectria ditissima TaxID=78410 RepID=A0A0P7BHA1_9HYPO|nr:hypothetical protein AK830_g1933 [Neonectria ditissima]
MCGRAQRPSQIRQMLEDDDMAVEDAPQDEGDDAPRSSYNFAPSYHGIVYRAETPDRGSGPHPSQQQTDTDGADDTSDGPALSSTGADPVKYKLQTMKWGLVPFWSKRKPDYGIMLKTINCRSDSLSTPGGMWASMKARKRCIVIAQGFFEWLKAGPKEKMPYFVKRDDGRLMCFAGLWDCVQYEDSDDKTYTYTIITTDSNKQLKFLHDRMPVVLDPGSDDLRTWLDPCRREWSDELQALLKPFDGKLSVYPVTKDVGKVGNNSPSFIIPLDSKENKSNIANLFANVSKRNEAKQSGTASPVKIESHSQDTVSHGSKRKASAMPSDEEELSAPTKQQGHSKISATRNQAKRQDTAKGKGSQKITRFFPSTT